MAFIKKYAWVFIGLLTIVILAGGANFGYNLLKAKAYELAKSQYEAKIAAAETAKQEALKEKDALAEKAGKDREEMRLKAEAEKRKNEAAIAILKSESAAELKKRNATIAEVLAEKEKDEMMIVEERDSKETYAKLFYAQGLAWKLSDERIEAANKKAMDAVMSQVAACQSWSAVLEKKLKPTFFGQVKKYGIIALAFGAGRLSAKI